MALHSCSFQQLHRVIQYGCASHPLIYQGNPQSHAHGPLLFFMEHCPNVHHNLLLCPPEPLQILLRKPILS